MPWADLNERQRQYMQAIYETDQEQEADERGAWKRGERRRPAHEWRWMEYGVFNGVGSTLYTKLYLRQLVDEGTGSTFNALEKRGFITCKYTHTRRSGQKVFDVFLMLQITPAGRKLVREATGAKAYRPGAPGILREWHWRAMAEAWKARPAGVMAEYGSSGDYGRIGWNTWLRLRDYKAGALIEEYQTWTQVELTSSGRTWKESRPVYWLRLSPFGEQFYRENWQRYRELYPDVDAPQPESEQE
jgi:hypothetical protein